MKYIIIQAGGKGTRLKHLTDNKPKALVSVKGLPLLINTMRIYPDSTFIVISDYLNEVLEKYLKIYAPSNYMLIAAKNEGTTSGIKDALTHVPKKTAFLITWCDLLFEKKIYPKKLNIDSNNYIGVSNAFDCRWSFSDKLEHRVSNKRGVAGVYIFHDKKEIDDIVDNKEFCVYLKNKNIKFSPYFLDSVKDIGTIENYENIQKSYSNARPFNEVLFKGDRVIKKAKDEQGEKLAAREVSWYKKVSSSAFDFIPQIYSYNPIEMRRVREGSLNLQTGLSNSEKKIVLKNIISNLKRLHENFPVLKKDFYKNNKKVYIDKTLSRLKQIANLIPEIEDEYIFVNGKKCLNIYKNWKVMENEAQKYYSNDYHFIHGDPTFSNTLYDSKKKTSYMIDPRGYFGNIEFWGDKDYDWSKLYYSLIGNYDSFNTKNFTLKRDSTGNYVKINSNGWEFLENDFFKFSGADRNKIKFLHSIIWLSLTTYVWDNYDAILSSFYLGIYYFNQYAKEKN